MSLSKEQKALLDAIRLRQDADEVESLLDNMFLDPDFHSAPAQNPLHEAVKLKNAEIVKLLVEAGADVNFVDATGLTPLDIAKRNNANGIFKYLKREGASTAQEIEDDPEHADIRAQRAVFNRRKKSPKTSKKKSAASSRKKTTAAKRSAAPRVKPKIYVPPEKMPAQKPKPPVEDLTEVFKTEKWIGNIKGMQERWEKVPSSLKKKFDFAAAVVEVRQETLRKNAPKKSIFRKPEPPPVPPVP